MPWWQAAHWPSKDCTGLPGVLWHGATRCPVIKGPDPGDLENNRHTLGGSCTRCSPINVR